MLIHRVTWQVCAAAGSQQLEEGILQASPAWLWHRTGAAQPGLHRRLQVHASTGSPAVYSGNPHGAYATTVPGSYNPIHPSSSYSSPPGYDARPPSYSPGTPPLSPSPPVYPTQSSPLPAVVNRPMVSFTAVLSKYQQPEDFGSLDQVQ
jgi:hypothetical protein